MHMSRGTTTDRLMRGTVEMLLLKSLSRGPLHGYAIARRIDGEILDAIGRLWFHGKGQQDPEEKRETSDPIEVEEWVPGDTVAWEEMPSRRRKSVPPRRRCRRA